MNKPNSKEEIIKRAKNLPEIKKEEERIIAEATELFFLNRLINHNTMQLSNTRMAVKRLMKERQLLLSIKKKWKS